MSRRLPSSSSSKRLPRVHQPTTDNPYYQTTTLTVPHIFNHHGPHYTTTTSSSNHCKSNPRGRRPGGNSGSNITGIYDETEEISDETNTYYEYNPYYTSKNTDCIYSDDETAARMSFYECGGGSPSKRFSRTDSSGHQGSFNSSSGGKRGAKFNSSSLAQHNSKDLRKIYPSGGGVQRSSSEATAVVPPALSRLSDRPQSSLSSGVTSAIVDGCGGHCQTFENACYYFLQVAFTMGILIGTSLSIAGAVLRKSAARNLQVLVYIGALLSMVSALLLAIQCSARYSAQKRKRALKNAKRAPIPLETLHNGRAVVVLRQQQLPLVEDHDQRGLQLHISQSFNKQTQKMGHIEHQGIPWWRRKDLV